MIVLRRLMIGQIVALALLLPSVMATAPADAASAQKINADVNLTLARFFRDVAGSRTLYDKAAGVLVFPEVIKAGFGVGGEFGEGVLLVGNVTADFYQTVSASIGFQAGIQARAVIIMFMTGEALKSFRRSDGWEVGVDGSVALITLGGGQKVNTANITDPVVGFVYGAKGLMYNLTLEGSKISRIEK